MTRPRTIAGLLWRLASLHRGMALAIAAFAGLAALVIAHESEDELRVVTFNIRDFPAHERQVQGAFELLRSLDTSLIAVQEIDDPAVLSDATRRYLGDSWRSVVMDGDRRRRAGLIYDSARHELLWTRTHEADHPLLEALFANDLHVFVVHLKAGGEHAERRRRQMEALVPTVRAAVDAGHHVIVLGDFNATGPEDRDSIERMVQATGLSWASRELACTAYWDRDDGCVGSALDHVLSSRPARSIAARGPCETEGCGHRDQCPIFHAEVSDHCPVAATW